MLYQRQDPGKQVPLEHQGERRQGRSRGVSGRRHASEAAGQTRNPSRLH